MDYAHLNLEHFFARHDDLDAIKDKSDFVMISNVSKEMFYRDGDTEGHIDLTPYFYRNKSQAVSFIMMDYHKNQE